MMLRRNGVRVVLGCASGLVLVAALAAGCKSLTCQSAGVVCAQDYNTFCVGDSDCRQGLVCSNNSRCTLTCSKDADCQNQNGGPTATLGGLANLTRKCTDGYCELQGVVANCMADSDCLDGEKCGPGGCVPMTDGGPDGASGQCASDADCPLGQQCKSGTCTAVPCKSSYGCALGSRCASGQCVAGSCSSPGDCDVPSWDDSVVFDDSDVDCVAGQCVRKECTLASECTGICDTSGAGATGHCVTCQTNSDCTDGYPFTTCSGGDCVWPPCAQDSDCPQSLHCSVADGVCFQCTGTSGCTGDQVCSAWHRCGVQCTVDSMCAGGQGCQTDAICQ
jgi:hypothetical protein